MPIRHNNGMNLRHVRKLLGTVSKAALQLRIAQPALPRQIGAFEQNSVSRLLRPSVLDAPNRP
jgi:hypothetical protein